MGEKAKEALRVQFDKRLRLAFQWVMKLAKKEGKQAAREMAKREAAEAKRAREAMKLAKKEDERAVKETARREATEAKRAKEAEKTVYDIGSELYEGEVQLSIWSVVSYEQINQFKKSLRTVENLRIVLEGGSEDEGIKIVVSLKEPMALGRVLSEMPNVERLYKEGKNIAASLKTSTGS